MQAWYTVMMYSMKVNAIIIINGVSFTASFQLLLFLFLFLFLFFFFFFFFLLEMTR